MRVSGVRCSNVSLRRVSGGWGIDTGVHCSVLLWIINQSFGFHVSAYSVGVLWKKTDLNTAYSLYNFGSTIDGQGFLFYCVVFGH